MNNFYLFLKLTSNNKFLKNISLSLKAKDSSEAFLRAQKRIYDFYDTSIDFSIVEIKRIN